MTDEQKQKAERNRLIFERALALIAEEFQYTREHVLEWLGDDEYWEKKAELAKTKDD